MLFGMDFGYCVIGSIALFPGLAPLYGIVEFLLPLSLLGCLLGLLSNLGLLFLSFVLSYPLIHLCVQFPELCIIVRLLDPLPLRLQTLFLAFDFRKQTLLFFTLLRSGGTIRAPLSKLSTVFDLDGS